MAAFGGAAKKEKPKEDKKPKKKKPSLRDAVKKVQAANKLSPGVQRMMKGRIATSSLRRGGGRGRGRGRGRSALLSRALGMLVRCPWAAL